MTFRSEVGRSPNGLRFLVELGHCLWCLGYLGVLVLLWGPWRLLPLPAELGLTKRVPAWRENPLLEQPRVYTRSLWLGGWRSVVHLIYTGHPTLMQNVRSPPATILEAEIRLYPVDVTLNATACSAGLRVIPPTQGFDSGPTERAAGKWACWISNWKLPTLNLNTTGGWSEERLFTVWMACGKEKLRVSAKSMMMKIETVSCQRVSTYIYTRREANEPW